jgi:hypothetical protein
MLANTILNHGQDCDWDQIYIIEPWTDSDAGIAMAMSYAVTWLAWKIQDRKNRG